MPNCSGQPQSQFRYKRSDTLTPLNLTLTSPLQTVNTKDILDFESEWPSYKHSLAGHVFSAGLRRTAPAEDAELNTRSDEHNALFFFILLTLYK